MLNENIENETTSINIQKLIKSSGKYDLSIFSPESIDRIEKSIFDRVKTI